MLLLTYLLTYLTTDYSLWSWPCSKSAGLETRIVVLFRGNYIPWQKGVFTPKTFSTPIKFSTVGVLKVHFLL